MVKTKFFVLAGVLLLVLGYCGVVLAQDATPEQPAIMAPAPLPAGVFRPQGQVIVPDSSLPQEGMRAHTMHRIFQPAGLPVSTPTPMYTFAETPASMACLYKVGPTYAGCDDQLDVLAAIWGKWQACCWATVMTLSTHGLSPPSSASSIAVADVNGDGQPDFMVAFGTVGVRYQVQLGDTPFTPSLNTVMQRGTAVLDHYGSSLQP